MKLFLLCYVSGAARMPAIAANFYHIVIVCVFAVVAAIIFVVAHNTVANLMSAYIIVVVCHKFLFSLELNLCCFQQIDYNQILPV